MKIIDVPNPQRIRKNPDKISVLLSGGSFYDQGFKIVEIQLRLYLQENDKKLGPYSIITVLVKTDEDEIEMLYDEGYRGHDALDKTTTFLSSNLGLSSLINRSILQLKISLNNP